MLLGRDQRRGLAQARRERRPTHLRYALVLVYLANSINVGGITTIYSSSYSRPFAFPSCSITSYPPRSELRRLISERK